MKEVWSEKFKRLFIWVSAYFSFIAFAIVGGYIIVKDDNDDNKVTAKLAFLVAILFIGLSALLSLINYFGYLFDDYTLSWVYDAQSILSNIFNIIKISVFAMFFIFEIFDIKPAFIYNFISANNKKSNKKTSSSKPATNNEKTSQKKSVDETDFNQEEIAVSDTLDEDDDTIKPDADID